MDTDEIIIDAWQYTYRKMTGKELSVEEILESFGEPLRETMMKYFTGEPLEEAIEIHRRHQTDTYLERLEMFGDIKEELSYDICLPAVSQGVIGVETRENDEEIIGLVQLVNDRTAEICVKAERALLRSLEGGCQIPIGAYAELNEDTVVLEGMVGSLDGKTIIRESITGTAEQCESLGETLANRLSELGGKAILEEIRMELTR
jgi:hypothetical protein